jgi:replicative DNA helicase
MIHPMSKDEILREFCHPGAERAVLYHITKNPDIIITSKPSLSHKTFLSSPAREVFICLENLFIKGVETFDIDTVANEAKNHSGFKFLNSEDGLQYLTAVFDSRVLDESVTYHIKELTERYNKARLVLTANTCIVDSLANISSSSDNLTFEDLLGKCEGGLLQLALDGQAEDSCISFSDFVDDIREELKQEPVDVLGVKTGFPSLDAMLNGLQPGGLYILAARSKCGKSVVSLEWAKHIAYVEKVPVLYLDTEMSTKEQIYRLFSKLTQIKEIELKKRTFSKDAKTLDAISLATEIVKSGIFKHKYVPRFTPELIRFEVKKFIKQHGTGVVVFDYIKLPEGSDLSTANETQRLGYLTAELKNLAGEHEIPIIAPVQFNRDATKHKELSSGFISASDRVLFYSSVVMALSRLDKNERAFMRGVYGEDCFANMKLQVLDARNVSSFNEGIFLEGDLERTSVRESRYQPALDGTLDTLDGVREPARDE